MCHGTIALDATIVEVPKPPAGRLPFLRVLARLVSNPVASWGEDFYDEPIVVYRDFGLETVFVTDPELTQQNFAWTTATPSPRARSRTMSSAAPAERGC